MVLSTERVKGGFFWVCFDWSRVGLTGFNGSRTATLSYPTLKRQLRPIKSPRLVAISPTTFSAGTDRWNKIYRKGKAGFYQRRSVFLWRIYRSFCFDFDLGFGFFFFWETASVRRKVSRLLFVWIGFFYRTALRLEVFFLQRMATPSKRKSDLGRRGRRCDVYGPFRCKSRRHTEPTAAHVIDARSGGFRCGSGRDGRCQSERRRKKLDRLPRHPFRPSLAMSLRNLAPVFCRP